MEGFTLTELLITVAILVILVAIGAPQLQQFVVQRSVVSQADTFASALQLARSEAVKRGARVSLCATPEPEAAIPTCSATGAADWSKGWLIWVDDGAKDGVYEAGEVKLKVQQAFSISGGIATGDQQALITYQPNGMVIGFANGNFSVKPKLSGSDAELDVNNRCVKLSTSGRARIEKGVCPSS